MNNKLVRHKNIKTALLATTVLALATFSAWGQGRGPGFERARAKLMLKRVSQEVEKKFYDPELRGLEWKKLKARAEMMIEQANSVSQMHTVIYSLVNTLDDSHTVFLPPRRVEKVLYGFEAKAFGDEIRIYELDQNGAFAAAGLKVGDQILGINNYEATRSGFDDLMRYLRVLKPERVMEVTYSRGRAPPQTLQVKAKVKPGKMIMDLTWRSNDIYDLIREAQSRKKKFEWNFHDLENHKGEIGYLGLPSFVATESRLRGLVKHIKNSRAVIVDLRGNRGGYLDTLKYFCGFFEAEPTTIALMVGRKKPEQLIVKPRRPSLNGPLFVLVDSQTASAAEMFARHFQRKERAVVIGDRTAGKVTVARLSDLKIGMRVVIFFGVSIGVAQLVFPDGEKLEGRGVTPDRFCIPSEEDLRAERDPCLDLAVTLAHETLRQPSSPAEGNE